MPLFPTQNLKRNCSIQHVTSTRHRLSVTNIPAFNTATVTDISPGPKAETTAGQIFSACRFEYDVKASDDRLTGLDRWTTTVL